MLNRWSGFDQPTRGKKTPIIRIAGAHREIKLHTHWHIWLQRNQIHRHLHAYIYTTQVHNLHLKIGSILENRKRAPVLCNREIFKTGTGWSRSWRNRGGIRRSKRWGDLGSKYGMISANFSFFLLDRVEYLRRPPPHHRDKLWWCNLRYESCKSWARHESWN